MNIAFASSMNSVPWGGSEILWFEAASYLAQAGHSVFAVTPEWPAVPAPIERAKQMLGLRHSFDLSHRAPRIRHRIARKFWLPYQNHSKQGWLLHNRPSILCISSGNTFQGLAWMEAALSASIPFITLSQAHADFLGPGEEEAQRLIRAMSAAKANYFVSNNNRTMAEYQLGWRIPSARIIANHSSRLPLSSPVPWPGKSHGEDVVNLACVGRLHPASKGQDLLFEVLAKEKWKHRKISVALYGAGDQEYCLRRLVHLLGIEDRVRFIGHVDHPQDIWKSHHALIMCSRYEGMPLVMMEAMLAGRPVISTPVAGATELIQHNQTGFLSESVSVAHVDRCLDDAWKHREKWQCMGTAAHSFAAARAQRPPAERLAAELIELSQ